jgi:hypothetical protein
VQRAATAREPCVLSIVMRGTIRPDELPADAAAAIDELLTDAERYGVRCVTCRPKLRDLLRIAAVAVATFTHVEDGTIALPFCGWCSRPRVSCHRSHAHAPRHGDE